MVCLVVVERLCGSRDGVVGFGPDSRSGSREPSDASAGCVLGWHHLGGHVCQPDARAKRPRQRPGVGRRTVECSTAGTNARSPRFGSAPVRTPRGTHVVENATTSPEVENRSTRTNPNLLRPRSRTGAFRNSVDLGNGSTTDLPIARSWDMVERSSDTIERSPAESGSEVTDQSVELADVVGAAAAPPVRTYVVQPHDTLWSIAGSQLGSPLLWPEIAQANYGRPQPDGGVLTDAHWIDPGWVLILPAGASAADTASPSPMSTPVRASSGASAQCAGGANAIHDALSDADHSADTGRRRTDFDHRRTYADHCSTFPDKRPVAFAIGFPQFSCPGGPGGNRTLGAPAGRNAGRPGRGRPRWSSIDSHRRRAARRRACGHHRSNAPRPAAPSEGRRAHQAAPSCTVEVGAQAADQ